MSEIRVMIVEDDELVRQLVTKQVTDDLDGKVIAAVSDARTAVDLLKDCRARVAGDEPSRGPDVIVLDFNIPLNPEATQPDNTGEAVQLVVEEAQKLREARLKRGLGYITIVGYTTGSPDLFRELGVNAAMRKEDILTWLGDFFRNYNSLS